MKLAESVKRLILFLSLFFYFGCAVTNKNTPVTNSSDFLTQEQIASYLEKAKLGDAGAAYRLSQYYEFWIYETNSALKWLSISATNGNPSAECNLGVYYSNSSNPSSNEIANAKYWFGRLALTGNTNAINKLAEFDKQAGH